MKLKLLLLCFFASFGLQGAAAAAAAEEASPSLKRGLEDDGEREKQRKIDITDVEIQKFDAAREDDYAQNVKSVFVRAFTNANGEERAKRRYNRMSSHCVNYPDQYSGYVATKGVDILGIMFLKEEKEDELPGVLTLEYIAVDPIYKNYGIGIKDACVFKKNIVKASIKG